MVFHLLREKVESEENEKQCQITMVSKISENCVLTPVIGHGCAQVCS